VLGAVRPLRRLPPLLFAVPRLALAFLGDPALPPPEEVPRLRPSLPQTSGVDWLRGRREAALVRAAGHRWQLALGWDGRRPVRFDPGRGVLVAGAGDGAPTALRLSLRGRSWVVGDYVLGWGEVLRLGAAGGPRFPGAWRFDPLGGRLYPPPALRGLAWTDGVWSLALSLRPLDLYQYRFRYAADPWRQDALPPCERPGTAVDGFRCGADGRWTSQGVVDAAGRPLRGITVPGAAWERLLGLAREGAHAGFAAYLARLEWRLDAPDPTLDPGEGYPPSRRPWAVGLWRRWEAGRLAWTRAGGGVALWWRTQRPSWTLDLWSYGPGYANPYAAGPTARPWLARRDQRGLRLVRRGGRGLHRPRLGLVAWTRGGETFLGLSARWRGAQGGIRIGGETLAAGARRVRLIGMRRGALGAWRWRATAAVTGQWDADGVGRRLRLSLAVQRLVRGGRLSLRAVGHRRDALGRRWLSVGDGDRLAWVWRGRRLRLGAWAAPTGAALRLGWSFQNRSKP